MLPIGILTYITDAMHVLTFICTAVYQVCEAVCGMELAGHVVWLLCVLDIPAPSLLYSKSELYGWLLCMRGALMTLAVQASDETCQNDSIPRQDC